MDEILTPHKTLILGTALWGWGITRNEAYRLLEKHLERGGITIDTATNYPINKCANDFGLATKWLADWKTSHPHTNLSLIIKIGAQNNMGQPETNLSPSNILDTTSRLRDTFGNTLSCVSIHWDNRGDDETDRSSIDQTVEAMFRIRETGLDIGLSGINHPEFYLKSNTSLSDDWLIQVKENLLTNAARLSYEKHFPNAKYYAYGINMGGVKSEPLADDSSINLRCIKTETLNTQRIKSLVELDHGINPHPATLSDLSLAFAYFNPSLNGVIIGPRNEKQLDDTLDFWNRLNQITPNANEFSRLTRLFKVN